MKNKLKILKSKQSAILDNENQNLIEVASSLSSITNNEESVISDIRNGTNGLNFDESSSTIHKRGGGAQSQFTYSKTSVRNDKHSSNKKRSNNQILDEDSEIMEIQRRMNNPSLGNDYFESQPSYNNFLENVGDHNSTLSELLQNCSSDNWNKRL